MLSVIETLGILATVCSFSQNGIILLIIRRIKRRASSDGFSYFPYCTYLSSSICWMKYGILKFDKPLVFSNFISALSNGIIIVIFVLYSQNKFILIYPSLIPLLLAGVGLLTHITSSFDTQIGFLQFYCSLMSVIAFGAPLSAISSVWKTKSLKEMSFSLCSSNLIIALLWLAYGYTKNDFCITICNFLGFCLSCCQLALFVLIPMSSKLFPKSDKEITVVGV